MSFIYEYQLRNAKERRETNLISYQQELETLIKETFGRNLKETITLEKSFEFRLYASVDSQDLRNLGKEIKNIVVSEHGFVRKEQILYAIIDYINENTEMMSVEFVDSLIERNELFSQRVNLFYENNDMTGYSEEIKNNYYIDVYSAEMSIEIFKQISGTNEVNVGDCYLFKAWHRRSEKNDIIMNNNEVELDEIFDYPYLLLEDKYRNKDISDRLIIKQSRKADKVFEGIESVLKLTLESSEEISAQAKIDKEEKIVFCVHNVGQALATSFSYEGKNPFLYFDYGLPNNRNLHTLPVGVNLPVDNQTEIVISHVDKDHWLGLTSFKDAFKCDWYIPNQRRGIQFNHKVAEIMMQGGNVRLILGNIISGKFSISCAGISTHKATRPPSKRHETGLALCVDTRDEFDKNCKILIEGDQDYDYVENAFLENVNILVACHHGGKYSWTVNSDLPQPILGNNCIIYSYGDGNSHGHPNHVSQHQAVGWTTEHHTPIDGGYRKIIKISNP